MKSDLTDAKNFAISLIVSVPLCLIFWVLAFKYLLCPLFNQ